MDARIVLWAAPVPFPHWSGAWKSMACAAQSNSMAMTVCAFRSTRQHFCELIDPMLLWSSWFAEVGIESTLAG
jgi:hypothetical protein